MTALDHNLLALAQTGFLVCAAFLAFYALEAVWKKEVPVANTKGGAVVETAPPQSMPDSPAKS